MPMYFLVVSAAVCLSTALLFVGVYSRYRWWETAAGVSVMTLAVSIAAVSVGPIIRQGLGYPVGTAIAAFAFLTVAANLAYRTTAMLIANRERRDGQDPSFY